MQFIQRNTSLQPFINFDFERFAHQADFTFIYGMFDFNLLHVQQKPVLYFELEEPNRFFVPSDSFNHISKEPYFWKVLSLCPYTSAWLNGVYGNQKRTPVFYPFNETLIPEAQEKKYDCIYTGIIRGKDVEELYQSMRKFNYAINADKSNPRVTHSTFDFTEKYNLIAQSRISVVHNLLFPDVNHIRSVKSIDGWQNNEAFRLIETGYAPQIKSRTFDAAFCKSLILCRKDPWNLIENFFEPDKHFVYYEDGKLEETMEAILANYDSYLPMIDAAYEHALANYTTQHFFERFVRPIADDYLANPPQTDNRSAVAKCISPDPRSLQFRTIEIGARPTSTIEPHMLITKEFPESDYIGFEVDPVECEKWNKNTPPNYKYFAQAIGKTEEQRLLYITQQPYCTSLYRPNHDLIDIYNALEAVRLKEISSIETVSLDHFLKTNSIGPVDFLKMDIQGAELDALQGGVEMLENCLAVVSEVEFRPMYVDQPLFGDVCKFMEDNGFIFFRFVDNLAGVTLRGVAINNDPSHATQQLWTDALFIRNPANFKDLDPAQLLKLAYIGSIYQCIDISYHCLSLHDQKLGTQLTRQIFGN